MARLRIPTHQANKPAEFVSILDTAWDGDRLASDWDGLTTEQVDEHPFIRYHAGDNRFDLDARSQWNDDQLCARDYLRMDQEPEIWRLRRLTFDEWLRVDSLTGSGVISHFAAKMACGLAVTEVMGWKGSSLEGLAKNKRLSDSDMEKLFEADPGTSGIVEIGGRKLDMDIPPLPVQIGRAAIRASRPPSQSEKKV